MSYLMNRWKALWHPERYHGWGRTRKYFEGWYFKMVSGDESLAFSLIPGISMDANGESHSFIQMIDGTAGKTFYERFDSSAFQAEIDTFAVSIQGNDFNSRHIKIDLPQIQGLISIKGITPWPSEFGAPGVMGWYSFVPMMQCYHGVVSLNHRLGGKVYYNDKEYDFTNGIGYIEKDWGTSFPKCWIWMQSNHFESLDRDISLMASVAHIPWLGRYFVGFLVAFWLDDQLYKFTTYNGSVMSSSMDDEHVYLVFKRKNQSIRIKATKGSTGTLVSPIVGGMVGKINESLTANIDVELKIEDQVIYSGNGRNAGLEVGGDVSLLLTK